MDRGELIEFLRESLTIEVEAEMAFGIGAGDVVRVRLLLDGDVISSDYSSLPSRDA